METLARQTGLADDAFQRAFHRLCAFRLLNTETQPDGGCTVTLSDRGYDLMAAADDEPLRPRTGFQALLDTGFVNILLPEAHSNPFSGDAHLVVQALYWVYSLSDGTVNGSCRRDDIQALLALSDEASYDLILRMELDDLVVFDPVEDILGCTEIGIILLEAIVLKPTNRVRGYPSADEVGISGSSQ